MDEKIFSEFLNNIKDLTLIQIFKTIIRLKYKVLTMFVVGFLAITGSAFMAGQANVKQDAAVMLQSPFSMRISLDEGIYDFNKLTLIEDPMMPSPTSETMMLSLRQVKSAFDIVPIGQVVARINKEKVSFVWKWLFSSLKVKEAFAKPEMIFNWNGHGKDYVFKEIYVEDYIIHRYYSDECILEYKLDSNRRSIPVSFRWIKDTHKRN